MKPFLGPGFKLFGFIRAYFVFFLLLLNFGLAKAQWGVVPAGGEDTLGNWKVSTTVGEAFLDEGSVGGLRFKFGIQQPLNAFGWPGSRMKGRAVYASNPSVPLNFVQVVLKQYGQVIAATQTNPSGYFDLGVRGVGLYSLEFSSATTWRGVNTTDALVVMRHFTGAMNLTGLRLKAGNVNNRSMVNGQEAFRISQRTVDHNLTFAAGDWAFGTDSAEVRPQDTLVNIPVPVLCFGDVNASYFPAPPSRLSGDPLVALGRLSPSKTDVWEWPIYLMHPLAVGAMTLELLLPEGLQVHNVIVNGDGGYLKFKQKDQVLRISWFSLNPIEGVQGQELLRLRVQGRPSEQLRMIPTSEIADGFAQPYSFFKLAAPVTGSDPWAVTLFPNPTTDGSSLGMTLPSVGVVEYSVTDAIGRLIWRGTYEALNHGYHEIPIDCSSWAQGAYSVKVNWKGNYQNEERAIKLIKVN